MASDAVIELTDDNFEEEVINSDQPVLVDFWAVWCPPCMALGPTIDQLAEEHKGSVKVGKLDTDNNRETAAKYNISSLPTVMMFKGGQPVGTLMGLRGKEHFEEMIANATS